MEKEYLPSHKRSNKKDVANQKDVAGECGLDFDCNESNKVLYSLRGCLNIGFVLFLKRIL